MPKSEPTATELIRSLGHGEDVVRHLGVLWGKSADRAGGKVNLLLCHLFDTAAVAEQMWDSFLAPRTKNLLNKITTGGDGLRFFQWLCGSHDFGKATPAFQSLDQSLAQQVQEAGLSWRPSAVDGKKWRHSDAGAVLLLNVLAPHWSMTQLSWIWPLVAGHHGEIPSAETISKKIHPNDDQGKSGEWRRAQSAVVEVLTAALGYADLAAVQPAEAPTKADQLALAGLMVMADWIASDQRFFTGIDTLEGISMSRSRERAANAWHELRLRGGWDSLPTPTGDLIQERFGDSPRPFQRLVTSVAARLPSPGLMILEAPMGEGKTKAALAAAEILAARFGANGVYVGMPTQATSDPMYTQLRRWVQTFTEGSANQVALLHGKRMFNPEWADLLKTSKRSGADEVAIDNHLYGIDKSDEFGPLEWFLGRKRGLLCGFAVGTIDQLLMAATRTRHVMLRFAGLSNKIVILDEIHAADIYMEQFLTEELFWLGQAGVPVILLSATIPPRQRRALVDAYLQGALNNAAFRSDDLPAPDAYPSVTTAYVNPDVRSAAYMVEHAESWRSSLQVEVDLLPGTSNDPTELTNRLASELGETGVVLIIHNTVDRAQRTYSALKKLYGKDVKLLHSRLRAADRAARTEECLSVLDSTGEAKPRGRKIVVATQVAEQSFDVDADLLITDLAPIDLILQRVGRLHRHAQTIRPAELRTPRVVVTGLTLTAEGPTFPSGSEAIYGKFRLIRAAAAVQSAAESGWSIPADVPTLVANAYSDSSPLTPWPEKETAAAKAWSAAEEHRRTSAQKFLLAEEGRRTSPTLAGLHHKGNNQKEETLAATVRDGEDAIEVVLVRRGPHGYKTWSGQSLGINGEASADILGEVLGDTVRLPPQLTKAALADLRPLDGWTNHPWLNNTRALVFQEGVTNVLGDWTVSYDTELGLLVKKA